MRNEKLRVGGVLKYFLISVFLIASLNADKLKISTTLLNMDYVETGRNGEYLDSERSDYDEIDGIGLSYEREISKGHGGADAAILRASVDYYDGNSRYDGSLSDGTPFKTITKNEITDINIRWIETKYTQDYDASVFASYGYREWLRHIGSIYGYKEIYEWHYFDIGISTLIHDGKWDLGFDIAYQRAIWPEMTAFLTNTLKFDLGKTDGYNISIPLTYNINDKYSIEVKYSYDRWDICASNVVAGMYEPDSKTKNEIVFLSLIFRF